MSFWNWLFGRTGEQKLQAVGEVPQQQEAKPGFRYILNWRLFVDAVVGAAVAPLLPKTPAEMSTAVLIPLSGALIGLTFAWAGNAQALLQTKEISLVGKQHPGGINHFACLYQLAILVLLTTIALWALAGAGAFEMDVIKDRRWAGYVVKAALVGLVSMCFRECWSVIDSFRYLLVSRDTVADALNRKGKGEQNTGS
jgi:hypothetical protein